MADDHDLCGAYVIPYLIRRHRKLIRCLYPWTVKPVFAKDATKIALVVDTEKHMRIMLVEAEPHTNIERLAKLIRRRRDG
jgi:hypothetical protein